MTTEAPKWPTKDELPKLKRLSVFDLIAEPYSAVAPGKDGIVEFEDKDGKWTVEHTNKHGFVKVWRTE